MKKNMKKGISIISLAIIISIILILSSAIILTSVGKDNVIFDAQNARLKMTENGIYEQLGVIVNDLQASSLKASIDISNLDDILKKKEFKYNVDWYNYVISQDIGILKISYDNNDFCYKINGSNGRIERNFDLAVGDYLDTFYINRSTNESDMLNWFKSLEYNESYNGLDYCSLVQFENGNDYIGVAKLDKVEGFFTDLKDAYMIFAGDLSDTENIEIIYSTVSFENIWNLSAKKGYTDTEMIELNNEEKIRITNINDEYIYNIFSYMSPRIKN